MRLPVDYNDDRQLRAAFSWLTRTGIGPAFGSRSVGWYQMHQCAALDLIEATGAKAARVKAGRVLVQDAPGARWRDIGGVSELYGKADRAARV